MKSFLFIALFLPACCIAQKELPKVQFGGGYAFYTGSSTYGNINGGYAKNSLKSGFIGEITVSEKLNPFLHLGLGASLLKFSSMNGYIPVYADIKIIGPGKYKLYSFLHPGYGFYNGHYTSLGIPSDMPDTLGHQKGGFYIGYGAGVMYKVFYLQATYHWLRFSTETNKSSPSGTTYGVAAITFGLRLP